MLVFRTSCCRRRRRRDEREQLALSGGPHLLHRVEPFGLQRHDHPPKDRPPKDRPNRTFQAHIALESGTPPGSHRVGQIFVLPCSTAAGTLRAEGEDHEACAVRREQGHGDRGPRRAPPGSGAGSANAGPHVVEFDGDDNRYLEWLRAHPAGYVVNVRRTRSPAYVVLHRATCGWISRPVPQGGYTERGYLKYCAETEADAGLVPAMCGRRQGSFSNRCGKCLRSE